MSVGREKGKINVKRKIVSLVLYGMNLMLLFFPWIIIGEGRYNIFQLAIKMINPGLETLVAGLDLYMDDFKAVESGIWIQLVIFGLFMLCCIVYVIMVVRNIESRWNIVCSLLALAAIFLDMISRVCTNSVLGIVFPVMFLVLTGLEFLTEKIMDIWKETKEAAIAAEEKERREREEKKERLYFEGKYTTLFYRFLWKNFKSTWKDYALLLVCSCMVFYFIVTGFGMQKMLNTEHRYEGIQLFDGLNSILVNAIIPLGLISVMIIIILSFYYLKCRTKSYGIFITLGMRQKSLQYFVALEFVSLLLITLVLGGCLGTGALYLFSKRSDEFLGVSISLSEVGVVAYLKSIGTILLIYLISFMAARDIFVDFNIGKSADLRTIRERMPVRWRKGLTMIGILICIYTINEYRQFRNFESVVLLLLLFVGIFMVLRYGMAEYLIKERKGRNYLKNLLIHNQLFHRLRTSVGYILALTVIEFCVLFYFSFQMISARIAEDEDVLYPYDIVCIADEEDEDILSGLQEKYEVEMDTYPMVQISNYDSTAHREGISEPDPPQGQHIGISESTYHALKKKLDPSYQAESLGLDAEGENIYVVHQQDKSVKAQPLDYYQVSAREPLIHIGQPCEYVDAIHAKRKDVGYYYKNIVGEELGSVTGVFRQGLRENLVVFSDTYFAQAQEVWKTTNIWTGEPILEEERIPDVTIRQGPTKLVLINADQEEIADIASDLAVFRKRHAYDEAYDASVSCYYTKEDAVKDLRTERVMKIAMNLLVMIAFSVIYIVLVGIRMLTEMENNQRRAGFLECMGMRRNERIRLIRRELLCYYYVLPMVLAMIFALFYTWAVCCARIYQPDDIHNYLRIMAPLWGICVGVSGVVIWCLVTLYVYRVEGKDERK